MNAIQFGALKFNPKCSEADQNTFKGTKGVIDDSVQEWDDLGFDVLITKQKDDRYGVAVCEQEESDKLLEMFESKPDTYNKLAAGRYLSNPNKIFHGLGSVPTALDASFHLDKYAQTVLRFFKVIGDNQAK